MAVFCLLCAKRFQTQKALQQHMEVHAGMHSYICSHCERPFPSHTTLKRHLRSHTGKRSFRGGYLAARMVASIARGGSETKAAEVYFRIWVNFLRLL